MKVILNQPYSFCQYGKRDNQEDCRFPDTDVPTGNAPFFLVCDGVGGSEKGEVASHTVCEAFGQALANTDWSQDFTNEDFLTALDYAYKSLANVADSSNSGMATTLTFAAFHGGGCTVAHIGDSRIYHIRPNEGVLYRSEDHSLVNAMVHSGNLTPEEAVNHPDSNIITRYVSVVRRGQERSRATIMRLTDLLPGDYVFLCSDGVLHNVDDDRLTEILSSCVPDINKIREIASLSADSVDNNTAYLIPVKDVQKEGDDNDDAQEPSQPESSDTQPLRNRQEQARDMLSENNESISDKIGKFFKKIF